jgi:hypothetical protein
MNTASWIVVIVIGLGFLLVIVASFQKGKSK